MVKKKPRRRRPGSARDREMFNAGIDACADLLSANETLADAVCMLHGLKNIKHLPVGPHRVLSVVAELTGWEVDTMLHHTLAHPSRALAGLILERHAGCTIGQIACILGQGVNETGRYTATMARQVMRGKLYPTLLRRAEQILGVYQGPTRK